MRKKLTGIRGLNGSLLARFRGRIKQEYGKTKDKTGSIVAREFNSYMHDYLSAKDIDLQHQKSLSCGELGKNWRKTRTRTVAEAVINWRETQGDKVPVADIVNRIRIESGSDDLRAILRYIQAIKQQNKYSQQDIEKMISAAYKLYNVKQRHRKVENIGMVNRVIQ